MCVNTETDNSTDREKTFTSFCTSTYFISFEGQDLGLANACKLLVELAYQTGRSHCGIRNSRCGDISRILIEYD